MSEAGRNSLFRQQVADARKASRTLSGETIKASVPGWGSFFSVITVLVVFLILMSAFLRVPVTVNAVGKLKYTNGSTDVKAQRSGRIEKLFVSENQFVEKGDLLLTIANLEYLDNGNDNFSATIERLQKTLENLKQENLESKSTYLRRKSSLEARIQYIKNRNIHLKSQLRILSSRLEEKNEKLQKFKDFVKNEVVSQTEFDQVKDEVFLLENQESDVRLSILDAEAELLKIDDDVNGGVKTYQTAV